MSVLDNPLSWRFARLHCSVSECGDKLALLLKKLKSRTKKSSDPIFGFICTKADRESPVNFHPIDVERATQCLLMALHCFPPAETTELAACCEIAQGPGYYRSLEWNTERIIGCLVKNERAGHPSSIAWEQSLAEGQSVAPEFWKRLWQTSARQLGIEDLLVEKEVEGYSLPELQSSMRFRSNKISSTCSSQIVDDFQGAQIVVTLDAGPEIRLRLSKIDAMKANAIWSSSADALTTVLGPATQQLFKVQYSGEATEISERLNRALPHFHEVDYNLNDDAQDKYYRDMLKPLTLPAGRKRVFPAIQVLHDDISQSNVIFMVNVVRSSDACWLEFQSLESIPFFPWLQQTLQSQLDIWAGPACFRWGDDNPN